MRISFSAIVGVFLSFFLVCFSSRAQEQSLIPFKIMAMAQPLIGDPAVPYWEGAVEWAEVENSLEQGKSSGVTVVPLDIFWGLAQVCEGPGD